jgi:DNA-binding transcriptional LysR family regulator
MSLNLNHLAIFRAVADTGSMSRGAELLLVSQPAVSRQIGLFEKSLGVILLDRLSRGVRLTHAGEVLAEYARRIFALEEQATLAMEELRGGSRGLVRVGASTTIAVYLLPQAIVAFSQSHPGVQVLLKVGRSDEITRQIQQGQLDVGYVEVRPDAKGLDAAVFRTDELVAIAARRHPLARKRIVSPRQLIDEPFVVRDTGSDTKSFVERELASRGLSVKPVMSVGSTEAVKTAVAAGVGVGIVSRLSTELEVKARRLVVLRLKGLEIQRPLYRIMTTVKPNSPAIHAFCQILGPADRIGKA